MSEPINITLVRKTPSVAPLTRKTLNVTSLPVGVRGYGTIWQFSTDGTNWSTTVPENVIYMRASTDNGVTWSLPIELPSAAAGGGNAILTGTVDPTTEGSNGDLYLNYTTWHLWENISGAWNDKGSIKGTDGDDGDPGTDGTNGNTILGGTVDPTTEGVDGDWYINRTTWHIWEKATGTWTDRGTIKGADGEDGGGVPAIATGDAGKVLTVKSDESGTEWVTPSSGSSSGVSLGLVIALT